MRHVREGSYPYALVTLYRYLAYKLDNDSTRMMYWLAQSVLSDIRNGVLDQGSMWEMANQLMVTNNVDRAYKYISYTCYCATRFGSRQRLAQIAPLLADIARKYKTENDRYNRQQNIALGVISVLAVVLLFGFFYVVRQRQKLAVARRRPGNLQPPTARVQRQARVAQRTAEGGQRAPLGGQQGTV